MTTTKTIRFWDEAARAFAFLTTRFGFDGPRRTHLSTEWAVEYSKGASRLRIVMDAGREPVVEITEPSSKSGGVQAAGLAIAHGDGRRAHALRNGSAPDAKWPHDMPGYLDALGRELLEAEIEFLSHDPHAASAAALCVELQPILRDELAAGNAIETVAVGAYERCLLQVILRRPLALSREPGVHASVGLTVHHSGDPHYPMGTSISCPLHQHTLTGLDPYGAVSSGPKIEG